ncbi:prolipoprotein diacylglyceryl transferase [Candidatus Peregrinibacteria bacterium]|nr:prolipoprotein diacylglyceryl transferase [Candidatus Peregrinibacteria bacterium]
MYPILFALGPIEMHTSSLLLSIGFIIGILLLLKNIQLQRISMEFLMKNYFLFFIVGFLGARIFYILMHLESYQGMYPQNPLLSVFKIWDKNMSLAGGILSVMAMLIYYAKKEHEDIAKWLDAITNPTIIVFIFYHVGNFFEGANYGNETMLPWGVIFEGTNVKYTVPIHPTQIYALIYTISILINLKIMKERRNMFKIPGQYFLHALAFYSLFNFVEGFFRGDDIFMFGTLRIDQLMAALLCIIALFCIKTHVFRPKSP